LTKEDKAQFDDEVRTITNSEDPQDVKSYQDIPLEKAPILSIIDRTQSA